MKVKGLKPIVISKAPGKSRKAVVKFKRIQTLSRKCLGLALHSDVKINLVIYDPKYHKVTQHFTDDQVTLDAVRDMMDGRVRNAYMKRDL